MSWIGKRDRKIDRYQDIPRLLIERVIVACIDQKDFLIKHSLSLKEITSKIKPSIPISTINYITTPLRSRAPPTTPLSSLSSTPATISARKIRQPQKCRHLK